MYRFGGQCMCAFRAFRPVGGSRSCGSNQHRYTRSRHDEDELQGRTGSSVMPAAARITVVKSCTMSGTCRLITTSGESALDKMRRHGFASSSVNILCRGPTSRDTVSACMPPVNAPTPPEGPRARRLRGAPRRWMMASCGTYDT